MKPQIKKFLPVIITSAIIVTLVLLRSFSSNRFNPEPVMLKEEELILSAFLTIEQANELKGDVVILVPDSASAISLSINALLLKIPPEEITARENTRKILQKDVTVLIYSDDPSLSSRLWMIIKQMGCRNLFILSEGSSGEHFKYKFRPDTLSGPELLIAQ